MDTDQPLLTSWATPPLMSAKMRISPVSWIVSRETGQGQEGYTLLEPVPGITPAD